MEQTPACQGNGAPSEAGLSPQTSALWSFNKTQGTHRHLEWNQCCTKNTHRLWNTQVLPRPSKNTVSLLCDSRKSGGLSPRSSWLQGVGHKAIHTEHEIQ